MYSALQTQRCRLAIATAVAALLVTAPADAQRQRLTRYSTAQGLPGSRVTAMVQDTLGYVWFGTSAGLARYDGSSYRIFTTADGLAANAVAALAAGAQGQVLVATRGGGLNVVGGGRVVARGSDAVPLDRPRSLSVDVEGVLWIATEGSLATYAQERVEMLATASMLPPGCCTAAVRDRRGRVWLGSGTGLYRLQAGSISPVEGTNAAVNVIVDADDGLWVGTRAGLFRERAGQLVSVSGPDEVTALAVDPAGGLWVGTATGEVFRRGAAPVHIDRASGLAEGPIRALMVDREASLWIGTDDGVAKWMATSFVTFDERLGLPGEFIVAVEAAPTGVWVASRSAVSQVLADGSIEKAFGSGDGALTALAADGDDVVAAAGNALLSWKRGEPVRNLASAPEPISALAIGDREVWVGTSTGLLRYADGELHAAAGQLAGGAVTALARDAGGSLWIGTESAGLFVQRQEIEPVPAVPHTAILDLAADAGGSMWVGTNGNGLLQVTPDGSVVRLTHEQNGLVSDFVQQVVPAAGGRVWLYTHHGLDFWDPVLGVTHYGLRDGLPTLTGNPGAGAMDAAGFVWFGTSDGLALYRPLEAVDSGVPPQVRLEAVTLDGEEIDAEDLLNLGSNIGVLNFRYTALTFRDEHSTRFQYRLRGFSEQWSKLTAERHVSYAGLPPGDYTFEVQAIDDRGRWSESAASAPFAIRPALWQRSSFQIALGVLALVALLALFRSRLRTVEDERQRLRRMVDKRTLELVEKNALLERMATTDELTGLPNRRFFLESMQRELRKMARAGIDDELSLLVIDLDRFKSINDRFGHAAGDEVLRQVAKRLARGVRATDLPARYGGEEFAILLPSTGGDGGRFLAEKLRADLEALDLRFEGTRIPVTISVGVASLRTPPRYEPELEEDLLKRADEAMYQAKSGGRNRVVVAV